MEKQFFLNLFLITIIFIVKSNGMFVNNKDVYDFEGIEDKKYKLGVKIPYGAVFYNEPHFRVVDLRKIKNLNFHLSEILNRITQKANKCQNERCMKVVNVKDPKETSTENGPSENDIINEENNFVFKTRRVRSDGYRNKAISDVIDSMKKEHLSKAVPGDHKIIEETFKKLKESISGEEKITKRKAARSNAGSVFELLAEEKEKPSETSEEEQGTPELLSLIKLLSKHKSKNFSSKKY